MPANSPITVAVGRFDDLFALGLRTLLEEDPAVSVVALDIAPERLSVTLQTRRPSVLVLDVGGLRDLAQVRELSAQHPLTRLVLFTQGLAAAEAAQLLAFGASACLARSTQARDVRNTIYLASRGLQVTPLAAHDPNGPRATDALLTQREGDVLQMLRQGHSNGQIALELQIGVETVRTHARNIYRKLGVSSRRALMAQPTPPAESSQESPGRSRHRAAPRGVERRPARR